MLVFVPFICFGFGFSLVLNLIKTAIDEIWRSLDD